MDTCRLPGVTQPTINWALYTTHKRHGSSPLTREKKEVVVGLLCKKIPRAGEVLVGPYDEYRVTFMFSSTWYIVGMSKGGIYITVLNLFGTNGLVETLLS